MRSSPRFRVTFGYRARAKAFVESPRVDAEFLQHFYWRLVDRQELILRRSRKHFVAIGASALIFELLNRNLIGELAVSGIKLSGLSFLHLLLPAVIAYCYLVAFHGWVGYQILRGIAEDFIAVAFPGFRASGLAAALAPSSNVVSEEVPYALVPPRARKALVVADGMQVVVFVVGPVVFLVYAYIQLFGREGFGDSGLWIALGLTVALVVGSWIYMLKSFNLLIEHEFRG